MDWARYLGAGLTASYGVLILVSGFSMMRVKDDKPARKGPSLARLAWSLVGLILVAASFLIAGRNDLAWWLLLGALLAIHILAVMNGLWMHGKLNPLHHFVRLLFSAALLALAYLALFG